MTECETCKNGCECTKDDPVCEHYACWGRAPRDHKATCPGAEKERERTRRNLAEYGLGVSFRPTWS
jgi:hypothetical protein